MQAEGGGERDCFKDNTLMDLKNERRGHKSRNADKKMLE